MNKIMEKDPRECGIICSAYGLPSGFNLLDFPYVLKQRNRYYPFRILSYPSWYAVEAYEDNVHGSFLFEAEILRCGKLTNYLLNWHEVAKYNLLPAISIPLRPRKLKKLPRVFV